MLKEQLQAILAHEEELNMRLSQPDTLQDLDLWRQLMKEQADLQPLCEAVKIYFKLESELADLKGLEKDKDLGDMVKEELPKVKAQLEKQEEDIKKMLLPHDPNDDKDVILEVRAGTGGEEAALFAGDLLRMYLRYAQMKGFKTEVLSLSEAERGGVKEAVVSVVGQGAYAKLKFESGVHRVQRVPETEASGRIHTSAATVAVMPEHEDVVIDIKETDLKIDTYRSSGAGGQHVNKTESAIRITHLPTGMVVTCQDERSQIKNREKAMRALKSRLFDMYQQEKDQKEAQSRKDMVGSGDRSQRIRTYNFPQGRVTDHRVGLTLYQLEAFMLGYCDEMIEALRLADQAEKIKESEK